jgi:hypothetical protein
MQNRKPVSLVSKVNEEVRTVQDILSRAKKGKKQPRMYGLNKNPRNKPPMLSGANVRARETEIAADAWGK